MSRHRFVELKNKLIEHESPLGWWGAQQSLCKASLSYYNVKGSVSYALIMIGRGLTNLAINS